MKNIVLINGIKLSDYTFKALADGKTALQKVKEYAHRLPEADEIILLTDKMYEQSYGLKQILLENEDAVALLTQMMILSKEKDNIFYCCGDTPFLDYTVSEKMYKNHLHYFAEYTYADGFPGGVTPEIIKVNVIPRIIKLLKEEKKALKRDWLFDIIKKDINSFDIETEISPKDLRLLRAELYTDKKRNFILVNNLAAFAPQNMEEVLDILDTKPQILRTLPAYFSIQITNKCPQACSYCPYPQMEKGLLTNTSEMKLDDFHRIMEKAAGFSEDGMINLSMWGEPALHSRIEKIIDAVYQYERFDLLIETSGIGWEPSLFEKIKGAKQQPLWIISLDSWDKSMYTKLRGPGFEEASNTANRLLELFPDKTYIQAVRMKENEEDLEIFYDNWKKRTNNLIIQKYDYFCSVLPQKKVTDLSPVKRFCCWHIKRDVNIRLDGTVLLCREDIDGNYSMGNIFTGSMESIWEKGFVPYQDHIKENYNNLCIKCDEYYTYNF